jgi:hypothetical protein
MGDGWIDSRDTRIANLIDSQERQRVFIQAQSKQIADLTAERDEKQVRIEYLTECYERMKAKHDALAEDLARHKAFVVAWSAWRDCDMQLSGYCESERHRVLMIERDTAYAALNVQDDDEETW